MHAVADGLARNQRRRLPIADQTPDDRPVDRIIHHDATTQGGQALIPGGEADVLAAEHRVLTVGRIGDVQGVADAQIVDQDRRGDAAAIDALFEALLPLQEANVGRGGSIELILAAINPDRVQLNPLIFRRERDREPARGGERGGIVDEDRTPDIRHRRFANEVLSVHQPYDDRLRFGDLGNWRRINPGGNRIGQREGAGPQLHFLELIVGILLRGGCAATHNSGKHNACTDQFRQIHAPPLQPEGGINHRKSARNARRSGEPE